MKTSNRYSQIIKKIFLNNYVNGATEVFFRREEIIQVARKLRIDPPKNTGDAIYSFRYRAELPEKIRSKAPKGTTWIIRPAGRSKYRFVAVHEQHITPSKMMSETKVPDSTPGIISMYALSDEQALLAKLRYNRLIDIFTGVTCYSLQNHLRTSTPGMGQIETDEVYVGIDKRGVHYVFPIQAKGGRDKLSVVQIEQDFGLCKAKFSGLVCRAIGAQFMKEDVIALYEFEEGKDGITKSAEKHYKLVHPDEVTTDELKSYLIRTN